MANDLRLQVIMDLANRASAPLRNISASSADAAKALKAARDQLKQLNAQQAAVDGFTKQQTAYKASSDKLKVLQQNLDVLRQTHGNHSKAVQAAEKALAKQTTEVDRQKTALLGLRARLNELGIGKVSDAQARLKTETAAATAAVEQQREKLKQLADQQRKVDQVKERYDKGMKTAGQLSSAGVGGMAAGAAMGAPVVASLKSFAEQESATARLQSAMMLANGSISSEYKQLEELAIRLGDKLPGTTADFIDMMRVLKDQGVSAASILGGTGEAAAYLAVKLRMPVAEAATFAAQMQDATRSTEAEMMSLMDTIQKTNGLGLDSNYMLQGFSKMSPVLNVIKKQGVEAANSLAPLLAMMNQAGMTDGGSAGNAIRKVFQAGLNADKVGKGNKAAKEAGLSFKLDFVDANGNFAGLDNLYAQLEKLKSIKSDQTRVAVIKQVFGDDAETLQVLETMMLKGISGYQETVAKLQAQADLRQRVNSELTTLSNTWESATGTFTNMLAAIGATLAPQAKEIVDWLGGVAGGLRAWIAANPVLAGGIAKVVAVAAALTFSIGALLLAVGSIMGPFMIMRLGMGLLGIKLSALGSAIGIVTKAFALLRAGLLLLAANPVVLAITVAVIALAAAAYLIYRNWGGIVAFFTGIWTSLKTGLSSLWQSFVTMGGQLMDGLINGITSRLSAVKDTVVQAAGSISDWFKEKLGIHSPSRVFMDAGLNIGEGAAIGIERSLALVRTASAGLAAATAIGMPGLALADTGTALPALKAPAIQAPALPTLKAPAIQAPTLPALKAPAIQAPALPALKAPAIQAPALPVLKAPAIQAPTLPALKAPAIQAPTLPVLKAPAIQAPALPTLKAPAIQAPALPALKAPAIQAPALQPLRLDTRPPLAAPGAAAPMTGGSNIQITINAAPGMDPQAIARAVSAELERRDRAQGARRRSSLGDIS